jgi:hypothetical protein
MRIKPVENTDLLRKSVVVLDNLLDMIDRLLEPGLPPYHKLPDLIREAEALKREIREETKARA